MELRQLKYFVTVATTLNFSTAAKKLFITQGTLSQQIKQLENELGSPLFHRTSHSVMLTDSGMEMLPIAQKVIDASEECRQKVIDLRKSLTGTLNIGLTSSFRNLLKDTVKDFIRQYPGVKLNIVYKPVKELHEMLEAGEIDFMIAFKPAAAYEHVDSEELFTSRLGAIMHRDHPLASSTLLTFNDLRRHRIILPGSGMQARKAFDRFVDLDTSDLDVAVELNDPETIMSLLHGTRLIAIASSLLLKYDPSLVAVPLKEAPRNMVTCVHWLHDAYRKRSALKFVELLRCNKILYE